MRETPNERSATVLWLLPAEPARGALRALVARLAEECNGPLFEPHLTLGPGSPASLGNAAGTPIYLRTVGVDFAAQFTRTLFVRLEFTAGLRSLRRSLGIKSSRAFDPHISVLYRALPEERKAQLACSIALPFASVLFDSLALVRCPYPTNSRADVESWKVVASRKLLHSARRSS